MFFDGMTLGPYDVLFVKLKRLMLEGHTAGTTTALRYQDWMAASVSASTTVLTYPQCSLPAKCWSVGLLLSLFWVNWKHGTSLSRYTGPVSFSKIALCPVRQWHFAQYHTMYCMFVNVKNAHMTL